MNKICLTLLLMLFSVPSFAQETPTELPLDSLYREDQFYASLTYNLVQNKPSGYNQKGFSSGFSAGFLRDIPLNKSRTFAVAAGLGYAYTSFKHNLKVTESATGNAYEVVATSYDKNKLELHYVDLPLEVRWRTSTPESHKFWRIYTGFKLSYIFASKSIYEDSTEKHKILGVKELNKMYYGAYIAAGWNTWNLYAYYGLNNVFKSGAKTTTENITLTPLNLGVMFYIL